MMMIVHNLTCCSQFLDSFPDQKFLNLSPLLTSQWIFIPYFVVVSLRRFSSFLSLKISPRVQALLFLFRDQVNRTLITVPECSSNYNANLNVRSGFWLASVVSRDRERDRERVENGESEIRGRKSDSLI